MTLQLTTGKPLLIPYVTGALTADWTDYVLACQDAGADAIEVGLPFSDPMLDGTTIQQACDQALSRGATAGAILDDLAGIRDRLGVPIIVMTYANLALRLGAARFAAAGVSGLIVPDLPLEESELWEVETQAAGVDLILLAAPSTPDDRLREIYRRSRGFLYAVSVMGVTGERTTLAPEAVSLAQRLRALDGDLPVLIGFGVSTPQQAAQAGRAGDGVVVASALMRRVLDGATPAEFRHDVAALRAALDEGEFTGTPHAQIPGDRR